MSEITRVGEPRKKLLATPEVVFGHVYWCADCAPRFAPEAELVDAPEDQFVACEDCDVALHGERVCATCERETWDARWWRMRWHNYTCTWWLRGVDCMCGENDETCHGESTHERDELEASGIDLFVREPEEL